MVKLPKTGFWSMSIYKDDEVVQFYAVRCRNCGALGGVGISGNDALGNEHTERDAIIRALKKWNRRAG